MTEKTQSILHTKNPQIKPSKTKPEEEEKKRVRKLEGLGGPLVRSLLALLGAITVVALPNADAERRTVVQ